MIDLLKEVSNVAPVYIVTSNISAFPEEMLERHKVNKVKKVLGCEFDNSKIKKINYIKEKHQDKKLIFITDTKGDINEGHNSPVDTTVAVSWGWHERPKLEEADPDIIVDDVSELEVFLQNEIN